jgi:hypothetical protein
MNNDIKDYILKQINESTKRTPRQSDMKDRPCVLFSNKNTLEIEHIFGNKEDTGRAEYIYKILSLIKIKQNLKFIFFLDDYTKSVSNNDVLSLCFAKLTNQNFITIPNLHLLIGFVDRLFNEVSKYDIPFNKKYNKTLFAGGANCEFGETRSRYIFHNHDSNKHHKIVVNNEVFRMPIKNQLQYKYLINIDGYGLCYDRLYWQMLSNSVPIYIEKNTKIQQIPDISIHENKNYIHSTIDGLEEKFDFLQTKDGQELSEYIINNNKTFIIKTFSPNPQVASFNILQFIFDNLENKD